MRLSTLRPGAVDAVQPPTRPSWPPDGEDDNAYAVSQGKRFYRWYNCNGCHAQGGGDIGPPLMDALWRYGGRPEDIYASIAEGRPNGMPSFGGRIPSDQLWQIVFYVRSMSGQLHKDVAPSRSDALSGAPPENTHERLGPVPESPRKP